MELNVKVLSSGTVISMTACRELSMVEGMTVHQIAKNGGADVIDRLARKLEQFTGQHPRIEVLSIDDFQRRERARRDAASDNDVSDAA
ncbi:MAG: hypothetical protein JNL96_06390 [Planctomycetaceae bacterium]|nr:hypothetical protein [Planctomycetaceae bacterium]